jgi:hypothetical protein
MNHMRGVADQRQPFADERARHVANASSAIASSLGALLDIGAAADAPQPPECTSGCELSRRLGLRPPATVRKPFKLSPVSR